MNLDKCVNPIDIGSLYLSEIEEILTQMGQEKYRAKQIYDWLHVKQAETFQEMTNLSKSLIVSLNNYFYISKRKIIKRLESKPDDTVKYLLELDDNSVESVLMKYKYGYSFCVSTQIGCKMGCKFCASAIGGFVRNLNASEMLGQVYAAQKDKKIKISHIVLMGMGEPLDNFENIIRFIRIISSSEGQNIGMRNISLSTSGMVPKIYDLMELNLQLTLSVSLHAPNDEIRSQIMPINNKWNIDSLLSACRAYFNRTGRRISFEYAMISGVNDSDECAFELAERLKGLPCHVNLIPVNEIPGKHFRKTENKRLNKFYNILGEQKINATVRRTLGTDINASCGQLRRSAMNGNGVKAAAE